MAGGAAFQAVITTYQVLLGISILLIASSLWIRLRKAPESVWLVRMSKGLIRPNYIFAALLFSSIFAVRGSFSIPRGSLTDSCIQWSCSAFNLSESTAISTI